MFDKNLFMSEEINPEAPVSPELYTFRKRIEAFATTIRLYQTFKLDVALLPDDFDIKFEKTYRTILKLLEETNPS